MLTLDLVLKLQNIVQNHNDPSFFHMIAIDINLLCLAHLYIAGTCGGGRQECYP